MSDLMNLPEMAALIAERKSLRARVAELEAAALRYYNADGSYETLASPEEVVERRKAAARRIGDLEAEVERLTEQLKNSAQHSANWKKTCDALYLAAASELRDMASRIGVARRPESVRDEIVALADKYTVWGRGTPPEPESRDALTPKKDQP